MMIAKNPPPSNGARASEETPAPAKAPAPKTTPPVRGAAAGKASVRIAFLTEAEARRAAAALGPDNDGFLVTRVEEKTLVLEAHGQGLGLLRTLDDALACLRALQA